jgi:hypothetical protein
MVEKSCCTVCDDRSEVDVCDSDRDVVVSPSGEGQVNEAVGSSVGVLRSRHGICDLVGRQFVGQAISANKETVKGSDRDHGAVQFDVRSDPECSDQDTSVRMLWSFVGAENAAPDKIGSNSVVLGQLPYGAGVRQIGAGVADAYEREPSIG